MDFSMVVQKLKAKLSTIPQEQNTLTVIPQEWDEELGLPQGSTAKHLEKALKGTKYSIGLHDHVIRLVPKRSVTSASPQQSARLKT
jgi:hypothetical protein